MDKLKFKHVPVRDKIIYISFFVIFTIFAFLYIYPIIWTILNSLKTYNDYAINTMNLPQEKWEWDNYYKVFTVFVVPGIQGGTYKYFDMLLNSLWILVVHVTVNVCSSALLAYALARFRFPGSKFLYSVVIFANTIPIIGSGPAAYKLAMTLNLVNNPYAIWVMWASGFDFAFIVFYGYFKGISNSYSESAKMDGANNLVIFLKVIIPQIIPCLAAIAITQAIGIWNNYSISMVYMRDYPNLAYGMYLFKDDNFASGGKPVYFAAAAISCIPVIILYSCSQELILTNMTTGGLKG